MYKIININKHNEANGSFIKQKELSRLDDSKIILNHLEKFFWNFCDNYIEIVKHRLYRPEEFGDIPR